jgi:hypothetical protein
VAPELPAARDQLVQQHDQRDHEQDVNQAADVHHGETGQPEHQQDPDQRPQDGDGPLSDSRSGRMARHPGLPERSPHATPRSMPKNSRAGAVSRPGPEIPMESGFYFASA